MSTNQKRKGFDDDSIGITWKATVKTIQRRKSLLELFYN